jgi:hypothetical protein
MIILGHPHLMETKRCGPHQRWRSLYRESHQAFDVIAKKMMEHQQTDFNLIGVID